MTDETKPARRVSDAERERTVVRLRDAVVDGRLTLEEFSERVGSAQLARTDPELAALVTDLVAEPHSSALTSSSASYRAVGSKIVRRGPWVLPQRSVFRSIFGTIDLDLRQATLHGDVVDVEVFNFFGTARLLVPEGIAVSVEGGGMFASQVIEPSSAPPVPGSPQLRIHVSRPGGSLYVRSREAAGRRASAERFVQGRNVGGLPSGQADASPADGQSPQRPE